MIVVGSPLFTTGQPGSRATGMSVGIARAARAAGAEVQIVGKVGEDPDGEAVLLDLAAARIGHVAVLRDPSRPTGSVQLAEDLDTDGPPASLAATEQELLVQATQPPALETEDLDLALRYLTDYRVIVVAEPMSEASLAVIARAATWASAALVVLAPPGSTPPPDLPVDATLFESPPSDPDGTFAGIVGAYAAAIDGGQSPQAAFAAVADGAGWTQTPAGADAR